MKIKVCGMRNAQNISDVCAIGVDMLGFIFHKQSKRYVANEPVHAGIIPDNANTSIYSAMENCNVQKVGVFVDEMQQTIVTQVYNYKLDFIQLHGSESAVYIENLKCTLIPDIAPNIKIIKALPIATADDFSAWKQYDGIVDMLLFDTKCDTHGGSGKKFDWQLLNAYDGTIPFLLSGGIAPGDEAEILKISHPQFTGIDLNSKFEIEPAVKDVEKLQKFIHAIKR